MSAFFDLELFFYGLKDNVTGAVKNIGDAATEKIDEIREDAQMQKEELSNKVAVICSDAEHEGREKGCEKAAQEFEEAFQEISHEYNQAMELFKDKKAAFGIQADALQEKLDELEGKKENLEQQLNQQIKEVAKETSNSIAVNGNNFLPVLGKTFNLSSIAENFGPGSKTQETFDADDIPDDDSLNLGTIHYPPLLKLAVLCLSRNGRRLGIVSLLIDQLYKQKMKQMDKAEQRQYQEDKMAFDAKIAQLKQELEDLKNQGNVDCQEFMSMICEMLDEIAKTKMQIAELKYLCEVKA